MCIFVFISLDQPFLDSLVKVDLHPGEDEISLGMHGFNSSEKINKKINTMILNLDSIYLILISQLKYNLYMDFKTGNSTFIKQTNKIYK